MAAPMGTSSNTNELTGMVYEGNLATYCQMGQDVVQEIVARVNDLFQQLKVLALPTGSQQSNRSTQLQSNKLSETLSQIETNFQRLHRMHHECNKRLPDDVEQCVLVPYASTRPSYFDSIHEELPNQKSAKQLALEKQRAELQEILLTKNKELKNLVDHMRNLVWEVNSILSQFNVV